MIDLILYRKYWESVAERVNEVNSSLPVTVDEGMAKKILNLAKGTTTLFIFPPTASSKATFDVWRESNDCVLMVMEKYDPQLRTAFDVLETSQKAIESIKYMMFDDLSSSCSVMKILPETINTMPETEFFAGMAGWSIGFKIETN